MISYVFLDVIMPLSTLGASLFSLCAFNHGFTVFRHILIVHIAIITVYVLFPALGRPLPAQCVHPAPKVYLRPRYVLQPFASCATLLTRTCPGRRQGLSDDEIPQR